jgi:hypothetical protein
LRAEQTASDPVLLPVEDISDACGVRVAIDSLDGPGKNPGMAPENRNFPAFF